MFKRILVPIDGSERAERAIPVAARIARLSGGSIAFIDVVQPPVEFGTYTTEVDHLIALKKPGPFERHLAEANNYITEVMATYADDLAGIEVATEAVSGAAPPTIFSAARWEQADLVIMCSHGETGLKRWLFGSVAQKAVRHSPVPVLILNENGMMPSTLEESHPLRVLVPLDGSPLAETAIESAAHFAHIVADPAAIELHLLRIVDLPVSGGKFPANLDANIREEAMQDAKAYLKEVTDRVNASLANIKVAVTSSVVMSTDIAGTIVQQAEDEDSFDLIAVTTHGRSGLRRLMMGSVTEHLLGATRLPLLIVRPHKLEPHVQDEMEIVKGTPIDTARYKVNPHVV